jgi:hypothetical protein
MATPYQPFVYEPDVTVTTTSDRWVLTAGYPTVRITVTDDVYILFGDSNVVIDGSHPGLRIPGGSTELFNIPSGKTHMAHKTITGTSNMNVNIGQET